MCVRAYLLLKLLSSRNCKTFASLKLEIFFQAAFARAKEILSPQATGAVLCGQKQMSEVCRVLVLLEVSILWK